MGSRSSIQDSLKGTFGWRRGKHGEIDRCLSRVTGRTQDSIKKNQSTGPGLSLSDLFFALPTELELQIIAPLPLHDILQLRLASKAFHTLITLNESSIATYHAQCSLPPYILQLYPLLGPDNRNLRYIFGIWHRLKVANKLATHIADYAAEHVFLWGNTTDKRDREKKRQSQHRRLSRRLLPLVFVLYHYLETLRDLHLHHLESGGIPLNRQAYVLNPLQYQVMSNYSDQMLLETHQAFRLVISVLSRHLRPEMYVGAIERSRNGYANDYPSDEAFVAILTIGGPRQVQKLWEVERYGNRRDELEQWYRSIKTSPGETLPQQTPNRISRLYTLVRRKSSRQSTREQDVQNCTDWFCVNPACIAKRRPPKSSDNLVFNSSLSSGPPMVPLSPENLELLLPDLPLLRDLWTPVAEVLLLERGVVKTTQEIKQNTHVILELIEKGETETDRCFSLKMSPRWFL